MPAAYIAGVYHLLNDASNKAIDDDVARAQFLLTLTKSATSMAVSAGLAGITGGAGIVAGGVVNYVVDQAFKIGGATISADILKNKDAVAAQLDPIVQEAVAAVLWKDPAYRQLAPALTEKNAAWVDLVTGDLKIETAQQLDAFHSWLMNPDNAFGSHALYLAKPIKDDLVDMMVLHQS
jgi:hypothetical protein